MSRGLGDGIVTSVQWGYVMGLSPLSGGAMRWGCHLCAVGLCDELVTSEQWGYVMGLSPLSREAVLRLKAGQ